MNIFPDKEIYVYFSKQELHKHLNFPSCDDQNNPFYSNMKGIEIDWQTRFWYLPSYLSGIIFNINYTLLETDSKRRFWYDQTIEIPTYPYIETVFIDSFQVNSVLSTPDQTLKFSLGYELGGFSGRVSLTYQAEAVSYVDLYRNRNESDEELFRWDIQMSQKLMEGLKVYINMNNIGDWPDVSSMTYSRKQKTGIENYGWSMDLGFQYEY